MKIKENFLFKIIFISYIVIFTLIIDRIPLSMILIGVSFAICWLIYPFFIKFLKSEKDVQQIKEDGPTWHESKTGTPTMGGLLFILVPILLGISFTIYYLFTRVKLDQIRGIISLIFVLLAFGLIGFIDDYKKVSKKQNLGLRARDKFILQILAGLIYLFLSPTQPFKNSKGLIVSGLVFLFALIWIVGFSNAVNLTDGIDGLASGTTLIVLSFYIILAIKQDNTAIILIGSLLFGAISAFLWFNFKPAQIFMGDLGSLSIGAFLAAASIQLNAIWSLLFVGIIFVGETLSDIIQVGVHHFTGKRVFKMAPLHHHLELTGWSEVKINYVSYGITLIMAILTSIILIAN